jgi:hypothetical protein
MNSVLANSNAPIAKKITKKTNNKTEELKKKKIELVKKLCNLNV